MNQLVDIIKLLSIVSSCLKGYMLFFSLGRMEFVCVYKQETLSHKVFITSVSCWKWKSNVSFRLVVLWELRGGCLTGVFFPSPFSGERKAFHCHYYYLNKPLNDSLQNSKTLLLCFHSTCSFLLVLFSLVLFCFYFVRVTPFKNSQDKYLLHKKHHQF